MLIKDENYLFFILFFILTALIVWACFDIFRLLKKEREQFSSIKNELFLKISEDFKKKFAQEIEENIVEFKNEFKKTSEEIIKSYKSQFESADEQIKILLTELNQAAKKEFSKIQETNLKTSEELSKDFTQKFAKIYQLTQDSLNKKVAETEKEIENYKKERFKEIDQKIYQLLGEVAKKTIGKAVDLSTHEKLVMDALQKAKKEGIF